MQADLHLPTLSPASRFPALRRKSFALKALPAAVALLFSPAGWTIDIVGGAGLPQNGSVISGTASGSVSGNQLTINQTSTRAVVDWASFNIDAGKAVQILQPSAASAMLNRVTGDANPSQILGTLTANGTVMLMNPNGVMFGQNATVNVGSLIATTGNIDVDEFLATGGAKITGAMGNVTNHGSITAQAAGLVALVAPSVTNQGSITATGGTIALAGSTAATVSLNGGLYEFAIPTGATGTSVSNTAGASLDGATLRLGVGDAANLLSGVINLEGVQQASDAIVVNGHAVVLKSALQASSVSGNANRVDVYSGARIQDAVNIAKTGSPGAGAAVDVHAGSYAEQVALNKANMTLTGLAGAKIVVPDTAGQLNGISITANNVTVTGMEIAGPANQPYTSYVWGSGITRGIAVANGVTGFAITNNNIHDVRNGILIDGRNTGSVTGNRIENTKSAISVQYTDGAGITMAGNSQGPVGNEWGLNLHLNGYLSGANILSNPMAAAPTLAWQQSLLGLSAANGGWSVQDQAYTSSNRTHVNVAEGGTGAQGSALTPLGSIQAGVDAVVTGGTVNVGAGNYSGSVSITKALTLDGAGMGQTIVRGPSATSGDAIAIKASGVTVSDLSINDSYYGIHLKDTSNNMTIDRVAFNNNKYSVRSAGDTKADNFRMLNSTISGGLIGFQTYNNYGAGTGNASFKNALFENVSVDGTSFKGFYFETADNLTMRNVTITNAGNTGDPTSHLYGAAIDVNLKYGAYGSINLDNVTVKNSGNATSAAVVIKTRGIPGDSSDYTRAPASLQSVNITGGSIEDSVQTGIRFETLSNGSGGQPTVTISGTRFKNNRGNEGKDIVVDNTSVDARGAVFEGAADGFAIEDRVTHALDTTGRGLVTWTDGNVYVTQDSGSLQRGVDAVVAGGTVNVGSGTHVQDRTVTVDRRMTLAGSGQGATVIDSSGVIGYGIHVTADDVSLRDFTLYGPSANAASSYGIKVAPTGDASARLHNFSISNVTSRGAGRAELDLNGVDGAVIDRVTADGTPVGSNTGNTEGAGIQLTDSANVTITNSITRNNAWGGLALYQANRSYNQQMNNITVANNNSFTERNPVYLQDESASRDFGTLDIAGFGFAVRNGSTVDSNQYTWLQASQQNAFDFAVNLGNAGSSYIQGWNRAQTTQTFHVGTGNLLSGGTQAMSIATTLGTAADGATINVGAGTYAENVVVSNPFNLFFTGATVHSLSLTSGADGSGIGGTVTADGAGGFKFDGDVKLLGDTTLTTQGADIAFTADIQNAGGVPRALRLFAGSGANRGNVFLNTGGKDIDALGQFDVLANAFKLESTLWVKGYKIDALGDVALSNSTLKAVDTAASSTLNAGGDVTGSTTNAGKVEVIAGGDIIGTITGTDVVAKSEGVMQLEIHASNSAVLEAKGESSSISGSAPVIFIDAPSGSLSGSFGQVSNTGGGLVNVNGKPQGNQQLSSNAENNRVIPSGNNLAEGVSADEPSIQLAQAGMLTGEGEPVVVKSSPSGAGEAIDNGQAVELDMSPKNEREKE